MATFQHLPELSIDQKRFSQLLEREQRTFPRLANYIELDSLFERFADFVRAGYHVERVFVVDVFIRRHLPVKLVRVHVMDQLYHRDTSEHRLKLLAIDDVNLHAATTHAAMFLKSWLKAAASEIHAG